MIRLSHRLPAALTALILASFAAPPIGGATAQENTRGTGLPLPRFVSLKSDKVNVRRGPGEEYEVAFTFVRPSLPVEITQEFDTWRKIRDSEGAEGWVFHSLLSGERTALIAPWDASGPFAAHASADAQATVVAYFQPKVIVNVEECDGRWCLVSAGGYDGWIEQNRLWGVYPDEQFEE